MPILALDIGEKKIGVAISESGILASEYCTLKGSPDAMLGEIIFLVKKKKINTVVIGLPASNDSSQKQKILEFSNKLKDSAKIVYEDETLTSKEAERQLFLLGLSLDKVRERRDQMAAKLILDQYLNRN